MKITTMCFGAVMAALFTLYSCSGSKGTTPELDGATDYVVSESTDTVPISGLVVDPSGKPLNGVLVVTGSDTVITSENGLYALEKKRCVNGRGVVKFEKEGYFSVVRTAEGDRLDAVLQPMEDKDSVSTVTRFKSTEASTLKVGGMTISIPANSLVDEKGGAYSGAVSASVFYLDPNAKNFNDAMPGSDLSGVTADGKQVVLLSYGMVEVSLSDSTGGKLQLKKGAESELTFPVPAGFDDKLHKTIPLWYFDEDKGTWIEEGVAEKVDGSYKGKVQHFSWHNLDYPNLRAYIEGYVRNKKGEPLSHLHVTVSQTATYTNSEGYYRVAVPKNTAVFVTVRPVDYGGKVDLPIYQVNGLDAGMVYRQDVVLPDLACVKGRVTNSAGKGICTIVSGLPRLQTLTNYKGEYTLYVPNDEPITVTVLPEDYVGSKDIDIKAKSYSFAGEKSVKPDFSYDIVLPDRYSGYGRITDEDGRFLSNVRVTAKIDGKEFSTNSTYFGLYRFQYLEAKKAVVGVKSADYYGYNEKFYNVPCNKGELSFPTIVMPGCQTIRGCVVNTCGPSFAKVTLLYGGFLKKKRESYTVSTDAYGRFSLQVPFNKRKESKQIRIRCNNKQKKIKVNSDDKIVYLGDIEMCSDFALENNCVYVDTDNKILKFDLEKDRCNEMMKSEGSKIKHQIWCKSSDYAGFLVFNVDGKFSIKQSGNRDTTFDVTSYTVYLVTPNLTTYEGTGAALYSSNGFDKVNMDIYDQRGDDVFVFGSVAPEWVLPLTYVDDFYKPYAQNAQQLTYGNSKQQQFFTFTSKKMSPLDFEKKLKKDRKMAEKGTFRDAGDKVATVFANDNEQVLVRRMANGKWEATVLQREGIGSEPLFQCWKVDFSRSSIRTRGASPVEYMLRNEADIVNMVMFGPLMGIKFEKTNISDNKCGCSNPTAIVPAD
ncbi:MAG: carboxypeptidase regulatory-like domain-containing protein [Paludibacteraceae bacterium]|nr:carboxypeptidase regulatory-like domain-containing protein [Paludibacteraceae bacterium]